MARNTTPARERILTCVRTGRTFAYRGHGRPPKYHPDIVEQVRKEQRTKSAKGRKKAA
jgi:hypothetical protein